MKYFKDNNGGSIWKFSDDMLWYDVYYDNQWADGELTKYPDPEQFADDSRYFGFEEITEDDVFLETL